MTKLEFIARAVLIAFCGVAIATLLAGCTIITGNNTDLTQAGVINRSADGGGGPGDVLNETSGSGGLDADIPLMEAE